MDMAYVGFMYRVHARAIVSVTRDETQKLRRQSEVGHDEEIEGNGRTKQSYYRGRVKLEINRILVGIRHRGFAIILGRRTNLWRLHYNWLAARAQAVNLWSLHQSNWSAAMHVLSLFVETQRSHVHSETRGQGRSQHQEHHAARHSRKLLHQLGWDVLGRASILVVSTVTVTKIAAATRARPHTLLRALHPVGLNRSVYE